MEKEKGRLSDHLYKAPEIDEEIEVMGEVPENAIEPAIRGIDAAPVEEAAEAETTKEEEELSEEEINRQNIQKRQAIIRTVCSVYLLYLTYQIITDLLARYREEGWQNKFYIMIAAAAAFIIFSVSVLWSVIRKQFLDKK